MRTPILPWLLLFITSGGTSLAGDFDHQHAEWTEVLSTYVAMDRGTSLVDYQGISEHRTGLDQYLKDVEGVSLKEYTGWSPSERLAFLINAYNAFTVKLIVDNYPVDSIKDLGGWISTPWKKPFFTLLGEERHLDNIEHDMIRVEFDEPRIHFAVNCAAVGCPALRKEAFVARRLDQQLEEATRSFLTDNRRNRYRADGQRLELSPIFRWYHNDFEHNQGSLEAFVADRITRDPEARERIRRKKVKVVYLDYDWSLNDQTRE
ncbi:MAG: DUF547 domain-containing protein [Acidobacteriota bacterium]